MSARNIIFRSLLLLGLLRSMPMCSQSLPLPDSAINAFPQLSISNDTLDIDIASMAVDIKVFGNIAITSYDITFYNPSDKILEGELSFPLKARQEIVGFSMDVEGRLRKGVVVEKHKGRQVFESIVREGIDPGLIEKTSGNNFRARVYPIMPNSTKRIVISCQEELSLHHGDYIYHLAMGFNKVIEDFSMRVEVLKGIRKPSIIHNDFTPVQFAKWDDAYVAEASQKKINSSGLFSFTLPHANNKELVVRSDDDQYFYATLPVNTETQAKEQLNHIHLLWDISGSGLNRDLEKELELLSAYLKYHENVKVSLSTFNHVTHSRDDFIVENGDASALLKAVKALEYDGGSRIESILFDKLKGQEILLFTDGLINLGELKINNNHIPLSIINSCLKANHDLLKHLASSNKGSYIDLSTLTKADAYKALTRLKTSVEAENIDNTTSDVMVTLSPDGKQLIIAGKVHRPNALLKLHLFNGGTKTKSYEIQIPEQISPHGLPVARLWAAQKINFLMSDKEKNKQAIISLAKKHGIVTDYTSLMVLERLEDYVRFEIEPPLEWKKDYFRIMEHKKKLVQKPSDGTQAIMAYISEYKKWWNTTFPLTKQPPKTKENNQSFDMEYAAEIPVTRQEESTPPPPPPVEADQVSFLMIEDCEMDEAAYEMPPRKNKRLQVYINARPWDSTATYMSELMQLKGSEAYPYYLSLKEQYQNQPSFYLDVASYLFKIERTEEAVCVITNIAELQLENVEVLRIIAHKLIEQNQLELGILLFRKIKNLRPEDLQSYRDLALALEKNKQKEEAVKLMMDALHKTELRANMGIKGILLNEINSLINRNAKLNNSTALPEEWHYDMPVSIRIVLSWSTDHSDVDLWVQEPTGEKCLYSNNRTWLGGRLSQDITNGYGPEEYLIKSAKPGTYKIQANYYGDRSPSISGPITLYAEIFENYGSAQQTSRQIVLQLKEKKQVIDLGEVIVK